MPPNLEQANGRLFFKAIQTRELTGISQDSTQNASLKIVQENGNTALQAVKPDGSLGAKLVIGATSAYLESTTGGGGAGASRMGFTSAGLVGVSGVSSELAGIETVPTPVGSIKFEGLVADNHDVNYQTVTTVAPSHTILRSTTSDLILAGNGLFDTNKYAPKRHVITLGELHAYHGDGTSDEGGDAVKVMGRRMEPSSTTYEPASINLGIHHNDSFASTGASVTRGRITTTSNADLTLESGSQLRMRGADVVIDSHATVKIYPNKPIFVLPEDDTNNPHGYLEISHNNNDQSGAITLSTPPMISPVDIVVKPATGIFGAEADTFELGSGDVRYKFTVVGGQLQIKKRVLSTGLPDKTICVFDA
eukprot:jgi/Mesvir1/25871/Mv18516-RA.1